MDIDYRAVFQRGIFDDIPIPAEVADTLAKFIRELESYDFAQIKSDVIGRIYERLIPIADRKALGQYYTPPQIVDLIVRLTLKDPNTKVLDPACGSGSFLVKAYHRLLELKGKERAGSQKEHQQVLDQLVGVEINQFPAHLSVINLEMQNIGFKSDQINVLVSDFFDVHNFGFNGHHRMANLDKADARGATYRFFDAVVANPPYIRQEQITQKQKLLQLMKHYGTTLDKTSDIYSYFFVHASQFLRQNGRLGFITSNKWLEVKYGESLQRFLLATHRILAIIEFDAGAFEEALVNTCVVILEKEKDPVRRDANVVKFVRVKRPMANSALARLIDTAVIAKDLNAYRVTLVRQSELRDNTKWSLYIRAPPLLRNIVNHPLMTRLDAVANVNRGVTTGVDQFFLLDQQTIKAFGIERRFLSPIFTEYRGARIVLKPTDTLSYVFNANQPKNGLRATNALKYIEYGEEQKFHVRPSSKARSLWYCIGERRPAAILLPCKVWMDSAALLNTPHFIALKPFYEIRPKDDANTRFILAWLNSTIAKLLFEVLGRSYGGGVLEILIYETEQFPLPDPAKVPQRLRADVERALDDLLNAQDRVDKAAEDRARRSLDQAFFRILDLQDAEERAVRAALDEARQLRLRRRAKSVLVS